MIFIYVKNKQKLSEELADTYVSYGSLILEFCKVKKNQNDAMNNTVEEIYFDKIDDALHFLKKAYDIYTDSTLFGDQNHLKIADTLYSIGVALNQRKKIELSQSYFENALVMYIELMGKNCLQAASCHSSLGRLYHELNELFEAKEEYEKALKAFVISGVARQMDVCKTLHDLATVYDDMDEPAQARRFYELCLLRLRGDEDRFSVEAVPHALAVLDNLVALLDSRDDPQATQYRAVRQDLLHRHQATAAQEAESTKEEDQLQMCCIA